MEYPKKAMKGTSSFLSMHRKLPADERRA